MILEEGWETLGLDPRLIKALNKLGFKTMMPIQKAAIPLMLKNCDPLIQAQTGSGKTLAFVIPIIQKLLHGTKILKDEKNRPKFLVLSPTRQIAKQSYDLMVALTSLIDSSLKEYFIITMGGVPLAQHVQKFNDNQKGFLVWFGTVGRIKEIFDHAQANKNDRYWEVLINGIDHLYIDQGDRVMMEKGIDQVLRKLPKNNMRTGVFSATLEHIQDKISKLTRNKAKIVLRTTHVQNNKTISTAIPESLENVYTIFPERADKIYYLINFVRSNPDFKTIVFLNTCASVQYYTKLLMNIPSLKQVHIEGVHGQLKPKKREKVFQSFFNLKSGVLITTDVAARGIDFQKIDQIIQIDPPEIPEQLVHRIGRTARVNRPGKALLMLEEHENCFVDYLVGINIPSKQIPFQDIDNRSQLMAQIQGCLRQDRDLIQKSRRAFVSFMRSYKQHQLSHIFRFKKLNIGRIGNSFFLVHLPKIKQTFGGSNTKDFIPLEIDVESIPWKDKNQSLQHSAKLKRREEEQKQSMFKAVTKDIKNIKSQRKKAKRKREQGLIDQFRKQEKQIRKMRKLGNKEEEEEYIDDLSQNTEEIERAILGDI